MESNEKQIRTVLQTWAKATSEDRKEDILSSHTEEAVFFDVLPPMRYDGKEAYRKSWDEWQPSFEIPSLFGIEDLQIFCGADHAFCHGFIRCGGKLTDGEIVEDLVRATFCLVRDQSGWRIVHQHISMPLQLNEGVEQGSGGNG